jgi:trimeric autotransporter adhesin
MNHMKEVFFLVFVTFLSMGYSQFSGGSGTSSDPYLISTVEDLNNVRNYLDSNFVQTEDLDLSGFSSWSPIGYDISYGNYAFTGTYDGNNHTISNLTFNNDSRSGIGLFRKT